jgi:hypothetical protein
MKMKLNLIIAIFALLAFSDSIIAQNTQVNKIPAPPIVPSCAPPPNTTMVGWYPFDDQLPVTFNLATGNNGTLVNGPAYIPGKVSKALQFDGIDDYVESPSTMATNFGPAGSGQSGTYSSQGDFTIDAWIKTLSSPVITVIVDKRSNVPVKGYSFWIEGQKLGLQLADPIGPFNYKSGNLNFNDNLWHHVAVTVRRTSTTGITWYLDGLPAGNSNPTNKQGSLINSSVLRIGTRTVGTPMSGFYKGAIDELEIFNRELAPIEIKRIFAAGNFGKCKQ